MLWIALQWLIHLVEAVVVMAAILAIGAGVAVGAFWLLYRTVCKLAGSSMEMEDEYEAEDASVERL